MVGGKKQLHSEAYERSSSSLLASLDHRPAWSSSGVAVYCPPTPPSQAFFRNFCEGVAAIAAAKNIFSYCVRAARHSISCFSYPGSVASWVFPLLHLDSSFTVRQHTVRNLHFLSKNSTLISRENCRFFWGWKTRENVVVLDFLAVDTFDFTRKIV